MRNNASKILLLQTPSNLLHLTWYMYIINYIFCPIMAFILYIYMLDIISLFIVPGLTGGKMSASDPVSKHSCRLCDELDTSLLVSVIAWILPNHFFELLLLLPFRIQRLISSTVHKTWRRRSRGYVLFQSQFQTIPCALSNSNNTNYDSRKAIFIMLYKWNWLDFMCMWFWIK